jgi:hypothetical protein
LITPEFPLDPIFDKLSKKTANGHFTDRKEPQKVFWDAIEEKKLRPEQQKVITFYGIGGIGKSRLLHELTKKIEERKDVTYAIVDFQTKRYRELGTALIYLSNELHKKLKIKFKTFALVYAIYWKKVQPHIPLHQQAGLNSIFEDGDFISDVIAAIEEAPGIGWIGKTIKFASSTWNKYLKDWWDKTGNQLATFLESKSAHEIEHYLPFSFVEDIKDYQRNTQRQLVISFDTYESLLEDNKDVGNFHKKDQWVREIVGRSPDTGDVSKNFIRFF